MAQPTVGIARQRRLVTQPGTAPVENYRTDAASEPVNRSVEIQGPGVGIRFLRCGSPSFESFSELAKSLVRPGMNDLDKAMAAYRFAARNFHGFTMGWGNTEMTRFINGFGYSYCWGQADFLHLLYEACGLKARGPGLKGHSSTEVLIDGRWRLLDAFMRAATPSVELDGLATGREMHERPERWASLRDAAMAATCQDYWSHHAPAGTYEPWQDSRAMMLTLRRGESLRIGYEPGTQPCMAAFLPDDFLNGRWTWRPMLDAQHLRSEVEAHENAAQGAGGLGAADPARPVQVEYRIRSPYPLVVGTLSAQLADAAAPSVAISTDGRRSWQPLAPTAGGSVFALDAHLSSGSIPPSIDVATSPYQARYEFLLRLQWPGRTTLRAVEFDLVIQAHRPSVPALDLGVNQWRFVGGATGSSITHAWDEHPGLRVTNPQPYEGQAVTIEADVENRSDRGADAVRVRLVDDATGAALTETTVARIEPGRSATARLEWVATIPSRMRADRPDIVKPYLCSRLRVEVAPAGVGVAPIQETDDAATLVAGAPLTIVVRPLPRPMFNDALIWSSDGRDADREIVTLRAALVHLQGTDAAPTLYLIDSELHATLTPYLGHPDHGGLRLARPRRLSGIPPSEFAVAQWELPIYGLPEEFEVWIEARCDAPVSAGGARLLARRRVRTGVSPQP